MTKKQKRRVFKKPRDHFHGLSLLKNGMDGQKQSLVQAPSRAAGQRLSEVISAVSREMSCTVQGQNGLVQWKSHLAAAGIQGVVDSMGFSVPDETADGGVHVHDP